jgi:DNA-binding CsgD family transcriptional regulator
MSVTAPNTTLNSTARTFSTSPHSAQCSQSSAPKLSASLTMLQTVMEGLIDGILIVTAQGHIVQMNQQARRIFRQLNWNAGSPPTEVWRVCTALMESNHLFPEDSIVPESEMRGENGVLYRIRVRWLRFEVEDQPCILVTLEDRQQSIENMAIADSHRYGLTERESEVWRLRLHGHPYQTIARELYIAENTVKKHIKSIFSKRRMVLEEMELMS